MNREALYVSHIGEDGEELEIVDELPGLFLPALDLEGEDRTAPVREVFLIERMVRMLRQGLGALKKYPGVERTDAGSRVAEDATLSTRQIAQRVGLSPTPVFERIRRMRAEGYIRKISAVLDEEKLGCSFVAFCYIKMKQHTYENASKIMNAVQKIDEIAECYNVTGDYDFLMKVYVSSMKAYQEFVLRILGELDCIGGLNSCFVMGEVKNTYSIPVRSAER